MQTPDGAILGDKTAQRVTIQDNDPYVYVNVETSKTVESNRGVNFTFFLSAPTNRDVEVKFTSFGTAKLGTDYTLSRTGNDSSGRKGGGRHGDIGRRYFGRR